MALGLLSDSVTVTLSLRSRNRSPSGERSNSLIWFLVKNGMVKSCSAVSTARLSSPVRENALVQRGDVTLWLSDDATDAWRPSPSGRPGAPKKFSDCAGSSSLTDAAPRGEAPGCSGPYELDIAAPGQPARRSGSPTRFGPPADTSSAVRRDRRTVTKRRCHPADCRDCGIPHAGSTPRRVDCVCRGGTGIRWAYSDPDGATHRDAIDQAGETRRSSRARAPRPCGHRPARTPYRPQSMPSAQELTAGESEEARFRWCLCPRMRFGLDGEKRGVLVKLTVSARGRRIEVPSRSSPVTSLVRFFHQFLAQTLPCQRLLRPALVTRFQVEGMLLDVLDDVVLLHLALKRRSTLSIDSRSRTLTSATRVTPFVAPRRRGYPMPNS